MEAPPAPAAGPLTRLYRWVLAFGDHPAGVWALVAVSAAESIFFPIPPDVLLIALALGAPTRAYRLAGWCTLASVAGGCVGYALGMLAAPLGKSVIASVAGLDAYYRVADLYGRNAFAAVAIAGFTPIPYKVFTIAAGLFHEQVPFTTFVVASLLSRGGRFFLVAWVLRKLGPRAKPLLERHLGKATFALGAAVVAGFMLLPTPDAETAGALRLRGLVRELRGDEPTFRADAWRALEAADPAGVRDTGFDPARPAASQPESTARVETWLARRVGPEPPGPDEQAFRALNHGGASGVLDGVARLIDADLLAIGIALALGGLGAAFGGPRARTAVLTAIVAGAIAAPAGWTLKQVVRRPRPTALRDVHLAVPPPPPGYGCPSTHAAVAGAAATGIAAVHPVAGAFAGGVALVVGWSRVYAGVHYPGDVAAGFGLGIAAGLWAAAIVRRRRAAVANSSPAPAGPI